MSLSQNWARATVIARPWPDSSSPRLIAHRRGSSAPTDVSMNDVSECDPVIHAFEMEAQSALADLVELERKMKRAAMSPFAIMRSVLFAALKNQK